MKLLSLKKYIAVILVLFPLNGLLFADITYKVSKGDTLYSISRKYKISVDDLKKANNLDESNKIVVGQNLKIPGVSSEEKSVETNSSASQTITNKTSTVSEKVEDEVYTVKAGDTLYSIAKKANMTLSDLLKLNNLTQDSVIKVGQKIKLSKTNSTEKKSTETTTTKPVETKTPEPKEKTPDTRTYGTTVSSDSKTTWPVSNPKVTTIKGKASGVQLSAVNNESVKCISQGTVMYIGVYRGFGQVVFVQSKTGIIYVYAGLGTVTTKKGSYIVIGDEIGTAGLDSITGKPQLTFMVFQNGNPVDPAKAPRN